MLYQTKPRWTARQVNFLCENWDKMSDEQISEVLGKTLKSIRRKRERLQLKKASGRGVIRAYTPPVHQGQSIGQATVSREPDGTPLA
jgi:hypothetical protein